MLFSVVIPSYNREKVVVRAINSVLNQTFQDFEIIVVDDGSEDNTEGVVNSIADERIKYVRQENAGACVARNTGVENSRGQYVSFLDSDDEWFPEMLEKQYELYKSDCDIGCVYSNLQVVTIKGEIYPFGKQFGVQGNCYAEVLRQGYMAPTSVLSAKRECFEKVGLFDVQLPASQDDDMCFKLAKYYKVGYIPYTMASLNVEQVNRISNNPKRVADGWWKLWNKYENDVAALCGNEVMQDHFLNCAKRYAFLNDNNQKKEALRKYYKYGGRLTIKDRFFISKEGVLMRRFLLSLRKMVKQ